MSVILLGTLDTKGVEFKFVRDHLNKVDLDTTVIDAGVLGPPYFKPDITREQVFAAAGTSLENVVKANDRGQAVELAARGAAKIVADLHAKDPVLGILGLGGSAGTTIGTAAMRALPFGIPKLMVSTLASGQVKSFVGVRDITMMHSVVDISGINRISRAVLINAANALAGMVQFLPEPHGKIKGDKPLITATMFGVTTPCVEAARKQIENAGYEVLVFHATGTGGMTMESFIHDGIIAGVLSTSRRPSSPTNSWAASSPRARTASRSRARGSHRLSPSVLDMVNFGPQGTVPEKFKDRKFYVHNSNVTLMRTTPAESDKLGKEIAEKAAPRAQRRFSLPLKGVSAIDREAQPFGGGSDRALLQSIRNWVGPQVKVIELDLHINDAEFAHRRGHTVEVHNRR